MTAIFDFLIIIIRNVLHFGLITLAGGLGEVTIFETDWI